MTDEIKIDGYINLYKDGWTAHDTKEIAYYCEEPGCLYVAVPASFKNARKPTQSASSEANENA